MKSKAEHIFDRFKKSEERKVLWDNLYREAQEYVTPQRESFNDTLAGQDKSGSLVFDSTATDATYRFASNLQASLTPPQKKWVELEAGPELGNDTNVTSVLRSITSIMFSFIWNSNFDTQIAESFIDLAFGTGAIAVFEGTRSKPFNFVNIPISQIYLEEGASGRVNSTFRKFSLPARAIKDQWNDAVINKDIADIIKDDPDKKMVFVEAVIPEKISILNSETDTIESVDGFKYYVIECSGKSIIVERELRTNPFIVFRWSNLPSEIYGRGVVLSALPDIKTLNQTKKILLQSASIATLGMYTVADDGIINVDNIRLEGGALITVGSNPGSLQGPSISPLIPPGNPNLAEIVIRDLQDSINRIMFGDPLGDVNSPVKTATEIALRQQDLAKRIGSSYGKLQYELLAPLVNRLLDILDSLGIIDLGPFRLDSNAIAIKHVSPLAQAQDEDDIGRDIRFVETVLSLFGPELGMSLINPDKFSANLAEKLNVSEEIPITEEQAEELKRVLLQRAQQEGVVQ